MEEEYLRDRVVGMAPAEDAEWMEDVVAEALRAKAAHGGGGGFGLELLGPKALDHRVGLGVRWGEYAEGGERRLQGHADDVRAVAECAGRVCSGSRDGTIRVWGAAGAAAEDPGRPLVPEGPKDAVYSLAAWGGRLVSGHGSGRLRVWNVATGACDEVLEGHAPRAVRALAVCGPRLASGSDDASIRLWAAPGACERALRGHAGPVCALAGWRGKVLSGSGDGTIGVWDAATGARDAALAGHAGAVVGLAVHGGRLLSASDDGTIRAWALGGAWAALRVVEACGPGGGPRLHPRCLAVSGPRLVSGSNGARCGVRVWGAESLALERTLPQPPGAEVRALLAGEGAVWAGVGSEVVVWGRGA
jgi:WD40 repeat protein